MPDPTLQAEVDAKLAADPEMSNFGCEHHASNRHMHAQPRAWSDDGKRNDLISPSLGLALSPWL